MITRPGKIQLAASLYELKQARHLKVVQEKSFFPLGDRQAEPERFSTHHRTHRGLREDVRQGRFREDLLARALRGNPHEAQLP